VTRDAILDQFDSAAKRFSFPMLDNGYVYPADVRFYRETNEWLMINNLLPHP
jgi:hypothetical protein